MFHDYNIERISWDWSGFSGNSTNIYCKYGACKLSSLRCYHENYRIMFQHTGSIYLWVFLHILWNLDLIFLSPRFPFQIFLTYYFFRWCVLWFSCYNLKLHQSRGHWSKWIWVQKWNILVLGVFIFLPLLLSMYKHF